MEDYVTHSHQEVDGATQVRTDGMKGTITDPCNLYSSSILPQSLGGLRQRESCSSSSRGLQWYEKSHETTPPGTPLNRLDPVNRLPLDLVYQIFTSLVGQNTYAIFDLDGADMFEPESHDREMLRTLSHVSSHWRAIVINTPNFWSCLDIEFCQLDRLVKRCNRIGTYLERVLDAPLHLRINGEYPITDQGLEMIFSCLGQSLRRVRVISLEGFLAHRKILQVLVLWLTHGQPGSVHTLALFPSTSALKLDLQLELPSWSRHELDSFLEPIRVLRLIDAYFNWDSSVYHNLVVFELYAFSEETSPTALEFLNILSACPQLRKLIIGSVYFPDSSSDSLHLQAQPVNLSVLENVRFGDSCGLSLGPLLPFICCGSEQLSVTFSLGGSHFAEAYDTALYPFFTRTNTKTLHLQVGSGAGAYRVAACLSSLPNLEDISLYFPVVLDSNDRLAAFARPSEWSGKDIPRCPKLRTLYIEAGSFEFGSLKKLLLLHPLISSVHMNGCNIKAEGYSHQEIMAELRRFAQNVQYTYGPSLFRGIVLG